MTELNYPLQLCGARNIVHSPAAVMRPENTSIFHPAPVIFLTFGGLALILAIYIPVWGMIGTRKGIKNGFRAIRKCRSEAINK